MRLTIELYLAFLGAIVVWVLWPLLIGAGWVPTPRKVVRKMLSLARVEPGDTLYELGSGDGRIIFMAAKEFGARAVGIEADPLRVLWTLVWIRVKGLRGQVRVLWGNFFKRDLGEASVVTVYQSLDINRRLREKFKRELEPGTRVVSYAFTIEGWEPAKVDEEDEVYLYVM
ncbi:MAG: class I SAM-dependent methyltransferase [Candidatus Bathyarchaeota archaeon]|nr:MAG: class I SAM-dependent methyltransferase [Candidatus Bathyarchaeota archaeon]